MAASSVTVDVAQITIATDWWNGTAFASAVPVWSTATFVGQSSGTWTFALRPGALTSTKVYRAVVRAKDRAGNLDLVTSTNTFIYDAAQPVSLATAPVGFNTGLSAIYGTARDDSPGLLSSVLLTIKETACVGGTCHIGQYWNGAAWQGAPFEVPTAVIGGLITGTTYAWTYDATTTGFDNSSTYTVTARAVDQAGNGETAHAGYDIEFYLQAPTPSLILTQPSGAGVVHYGTVNSATVNTIIGTGLNLRLSGGVRLALQRLTPPTSYWYEPTASWTNDAATYTIVNVTAGSPQNWNQPLSAPYTVDNAAYSLTVTPINTAGLAGVPFTRTFVYDKTAPLAGFSNPVVACAGSNACLNSLPAISGTASDAASVDPPSIFASGVKVRLKNFVTGDYWNGTAFAPGVSEMSIDALGGPGPFTWSTTTLAGAKLLDGVNYTLFAHAADRAGNDQAGEGSMAAFTFVYDTSPPVGILSQPSSVQVYLNLTTISGTSTDPGGSNPSNKFSDVEHVELQIREPHNNICWSDGGASFSVACPNFFVVTGTNPWTYSNGALTGALTSGKPYTITARAVDYAGNVQSVYTVPLSSRTLNVDKNAPASAFTVPASGLSYKAAQLNGGSA